MVKISLSIPTILKVQWTHEYVEYYFGRRIARDVAMMRGDIDTFNLFWQPKQ